MGKNLADTYSQAMDVFVQVSDATGIDVCRLCWEADEETLRQTHNAQIALFSCSLAAWACLQHRLPALVRVVAGHSVGEYAALVAAGVYTVEEGANLVRTRGVLMNAAGTSAPGTMAAVLGLSRELLEQACEQVEGIVVIANDNCPGQLVISGEVDAVEKAGFAANAMGAKRVIPLNVSGAFHSPLMAAAAARMRAALEPITPRAPHLAVYANVSSEPVSDASQWPDLLERQLCSPVRWTESVEHMVRDGVTGFVECGVGDVLSGLIRRIDKTVPTQRVSDAETLEQTSAALS